MRLAPLIALTSVLGRFRPIGRGDDHSRPLCLSIAILSLCAIGAEAVPPAPAYHLTKTVPLGTPNRWDYAVFDSGSGRVYVAHGDRLTVVDGRSGRIWAM